ncbi:MAG: DUF1905 domain-containing protein [Bacteroidales bacterium]|nr:DUF1905 domain-containing protein [Bacteroidales bacterium]
MERFASVIISADDMDACWVEVPVDIYAKYGKKRLKVHATFDGHPYDGLVCRMGTPYYLIGIRKEIRKAIGKQKGDIVDVTIEPRE